jgi:hypothetical protein
LRKREAAMQTKTPKVITFERAYPDTIARLDWHQDQA